jgi:esterase/lipase superfamily enzyme
VAGDGQLTGRAAAPHAVVDLDERGDLLDPDTGAAVPAAAAGDFLARHLHVPQDATDIVVFVHGWRNTRAQALARATRFFSLVEAAYAADPRRYPTLGAWRGHYVAVRWPSTSDPFLTGYRRVRERAHAMTTTGHAGQVLGQLLGYLNSRRRTPGRPPTLRGAGGQYLHCVGHSFGGRFLTEAVQAAAGERPAVLGWNRADPRYPYTVDTLLVFQMAAPPAIFADRFARILHDAPINGPVALTSSRADRATGLWHRLAEGAPGIGFAGATAPAEHIAAAPLLRSHEPYSRAHFGERIVNVDATWRFRRGRWWHPSGAHSDFQHPESAHLLLSLAGFAR